MSAAQVDGSAVSVGFLVAAFAVSIAIGILVIYLGIHGQIGAGIP
jgi:hypothetical protein